MKRYGGRAEGGVGGRGEAGVAGRQERLGERHCTPDKHNKQWDQTKAGERIKHMSVCEDASAQRAHRRRWRGRLRACTSPV